MKNTVLKYLNKYKRYILFIIVILIIALYFFRLGAIPHGLHIDEAGTIYDALNLSKYGYDRYLIKNPVYFWNFGGGQNALMTYIETIWLTILPFNPLNFSNINLGLFILRLPALILNLLSYIFLYKLLRIKFSINQSLFALIIALILPFSLMHSRWILESYLLFPMTLIATYSLIMAVNKRKKYLFFISGVLFGLTFYTYAISYLIISLSLLLFLIYLIYSKSIKLSEFICFTIPLVFLGLPLLLLLLMNAGIINIERINYFGFTIAKLPWFRISEFSLSNIIKNLLNPNYYTSFLFDELGYNSYKSFSTIYYINIPIMIYGLYKSIKNIKLKDKIFNIDYVIIVLFISTIFVSLLITDNNVNKINLIFFPVIYYISIGNINIFKLILNNNYLTLLITYTIIFAISFSLFGYRYFNDIHEEKILFKYNIIETIKKIQYIDPEMKKNIYSENEMASYIYFLLYNQINPADCQKYPLYNHYYNIVTPTNIISNEVNVDDIKDNSIYIVYNDRDYDKYTKLFEKVKTHLNIDNITIFITD